MISLRTRKHSDASPTLRRGFFYALLILLFSFSTGHATPNKPHRNFIIQGYTLDLEGRSVPYVSLVFKHSAIFLLSDEHGQYSYTAPISPHDSVMVQRIGYVQRILSSDELLQLGEVRLSPLVMSLESVEVIGKSLSGTSAAASPLSEYTKTRGAGTVDHSKTLNRIPGITIKTYGGPAGISTLSMDGGPSSHTRVLVNGIDITSAQNGEADISQLPLPFLEAMNYSPYDIAQTGSGSSDGIVKLETGDQPNHLSFSTGSFGHLAYDVNLRKQIAGFRSSLQFGQRREAGNYPVVWSDTESFRKNNDLTQKFVALRFMGMLRPDLYWQFTTMSSHQARGVAGLVWSPDTISHREDQLQLLGSTFGWIRPSGNTHLQLNLRRSRETYVNPYLNLKSDHRLQSFHLGLRNEQTVGQKLVLLTDLNLNQDLIASSATNNHSRVSLVLSIAPIFQFSRGLKLIPALNYHFSPELYGQMLTNLQLQIPFKLGPLNRLAVSRGELYRYPSFNDQFWEPGGNPDLKAEETQVTTAQLHLDLQVMGQLIFQWQKKESTNLIQWMPVHSYWQPGNVQSATRESSKAMWQIHHPGYHLSAFAHLSLIHTRDHTLNKTLRYAPHRTSAFGLTWSPDELEFNLQYNYVSHRISMYDYPEDTILGASEIWSLSVARTWFSELGAFTLVLAGDNIGNLQYESIRGYPEPGRSLRLSATYGF